MNKVLLSLLLLVSVSVSAQDVKIKNNVFQVLYSQSLEQPLEIVYHSTNRPT